MKDGKGEMLYIGKAKSLFHRVRSYFSDAADLAPRTRIFVRKVKDIKFLTTKTEQEALILESNFIKKHQPRYNVLLKDDKHYPYIRMTTQETFPRLEVVRRDQKGRRDLFRSVHHGAGGARNHPPHLQNLSAPAEQRRVGRHRQAPALPQLPDETLPRPVRRVGDRRRITPGWSTTWCCF